MRWIIESSLRLRLLIIILAAVLLVAGFSQLRSMPVDVYPEFNPPMVEVQTEALGLAAVEVESLITVPMEADLLNGIAWLDQIYSESVSGLSSILMIFEPGTDPIRARQMVQERLTQAHALPNVSTPPVMLQPLSSSSRVMIVGLSSEALTPIEMGVLARWNVKPRLMGIPGVANVAVWGQRERQLQIQVDPAVLNENDVTLNQVIKTAGEALWVSPLSYLESSTPGTTGFIDTPNQRLSVQHLLPISAPEDLANVSVVNRTDLVLGDVAQVVEDHQLLIGDATLASGQGLMLVIEKFPNANTLAVTQAVEETLASMAPGLSGVTIDTTVFRPADYIELASSNLQSMLITSIILVALALLAFFFQWRTALISLIIIPVSLVAAGMVFYLRGETFNMMILAGLTIALAIIIDNAIIDVDNIARRLRQHRQNNPEATVALPDSESIVTNAILDVRSTMGFSLLIILLAVLPVFFLPGLSGSFFQPLVVSFILAVIASLLVALILTPALSVTLLKDGALGHNESPVMTSLQGIYNSILSSSVRASTASIIIAAGLIILGLVVYSGLDVAFTPDLKQTRLLIQWDAAPGTSAPEMNRLSTQITKDLQAIGGVVNVGSHVGRAITGDAIVGINSGEHWVTLDAKADYDATVNDVREVADGFPGLIAQVSTYQPDRLQEALTRPAEDIAVRIYGHDLNILREKGVEVQQILSDIAGVANPQLDLPVQEPQVEIEVDLTAAEAVGIKPGDVRRQATTLLSGLNVGMLFEDQKVFDVVVWGTPEIRQNLTAIQTLQLDTPAGDQVILGEVADVRIVPAEAVIRRDAVSRFVDVSANVQGRNYNEVVTHIKERLQVIDFPFEFHAEVLTESVERQAAVQRVIALALAAIVGIFLLIQAAFDSWRTGTVVFLALPMALAGGVLAIPLSGGILSIGSLFGLLAVLGIATQNSLSLVRHFQNLELNEGLDFAPDLVIRGTQERFGPILMTAVVTLLAFLPLALGGAVAGNEIVSTIAFVVFGGVITSTLLNLFVLPALYLRFGASAKTDTNMALDQDETFEGVAIA